MSASERAAEKVTEVVADAAETVSEEAADFAEWTRRLNRTKTQYALMGYALGAITGAFVAVKVVYSRAETKYSKISDEEIAEMRSHYREKERALDAQAAKRPLEEIVREQGYSRPESETVAPPMAVQPPERVVVEAEEKEPPEEPRIVEAEVRNVFENAEVTHEWDWHEERRKRSPDIPYVIHYDERHEIEGYSEVSLTYYEEDNVVCNERDEVMDPDDRERLLGKDALDRFGHGSNDASIVFVRNDKLEIIFEIIRSPNSFAEEVHGISHEDYYHGNLERMRKRERDDPDD